MSNTQSLRHSLVGDVENYRFLVVLRSGQEIVLEGVEPDTWKVEGGFLAVEAYRGDQIHYFIASDVVRFMTYFG